MVLAQERHHVFRIGGLGKAREAAQVAEQRGDLAAVAFQLLLVSRRDDQVGNLRRQEAAQPPHALDLADLLVDALLESLVQGAQLLRLRLELGRLLANFGEQSRVLDRDDGLRGEIRHQLDLLVGERADFLAIDDNGADEFVLLDHRNVEQRPRSPQFSCGHAKRIALKIGFFGGDIGDVHGLLV